MQNNPFSDKVLDILTNVDQNTIKVYNRLTKWSLAVLVSDGIIPEYQDCTEAESKGIWSIFNNNPELLEKLLDLDIDRVRFYTGMTDDEYRKVRVMSPSKIAIVDRISHRKIRIIEKGYADSYYHEWTSKAFWRMFSEKTIQKLANETEAALEAYANMKEPQLIELIKIANELKKKNSGK